VKYDRQIQASYLHIQAPRAIVKEETFDFVVVLRLLTLLHTQKKTLLFCFTQVRSLQVRSSLHAPHFAVDFLLTPRTGGVGAFGGRAKVSTDSIPAGRRNRTQPMRFQYLGATFAHAFVATEDVDSNSVCGPAQSVSKKRARHKRPARKQTKQMLIVAWVEWGLRPKRKASCSGGRECTRARRHGHAEQARRS
jgi:hypothetical protein